MLLAYGGGQRGWGLGHTEDRIEGVVSQASNL